MGSCAGSSGLPEGGLPGYQTVEGGGQVRITSTGFDKLKSLMPGIINSGLADGYCIPYGLFSVGNYCSKNNEGCVQGCRVHISLNPGTFATATPNAQTLHISAGLKIDSDVDLHVGPFHCDPLHVHGDNVPIAGDIMVGISAADGSLSLGGARVTEFGVDKLQVSGCSTIGDLLSFMKGVYTPQLSQLAVEKLTTKIQTAVQEFIPQPLGVQGVADVSQLIGTNATGPAFLETRLIAGGYASLTANGLNLGLITGINSDSDPSTRDDSTDANNIPLASEPNRCAPPIPVTNFGAPPYSLAPVDRSAITNGPAFALAPAGAFTGAPESPGDLVVGLSEIALNMFGHHLVTSGALCMGIGTGPSFPNLDLGDFNVVIPSIGTLQTKDGTDPVLLVGRPQRAVGIKVGDNTADSPALTMQISHLEVDLYGFLYERYVRLLTLDLSADIGVNLEFEAAPGGGATIKPVLVGVSGDTITVKVLNSDFVKEKPRDLESVLPSLFDVVVQKVGNIKPITVPSFAGFALADLTLRRVSTSQDNFLAVSATLNPGPAARALAASDPFAADAVSAMDVQVKATQLTSAGKAKLLDVTTPAAATIRNALYRTTGGTLPSVTFDVDRFDYSTGQPRELEWSWNLNGGIWHPYRSGSPLVISDRIFAMQGKYTVGLQSRVKGDYRTVSGVIETPVVIDSVGPKIFSDDAAWKDGNLIVPVRDVVSKKDVQVAFGAPGADVPATEWGHDADASLAKAAFDKLQIGGEVAVFARDNLGNQTTELVTPIRDSSSNSGCGCQSSGRSGAGALALVAIVGVVVLRRRRRLSPTTRRAMATVGLWVGASVTASLQPGCNCKNATSCEVAADCSCDSEIPFCIDHVCVCSDTVPLGHVGPYSSVAVDLDGNMWVSAYAQSHGDLVVAQANGAGRIPDEAWEWVDGVPDGPVVVSDSKIRNGIADDGPDVGMYTSIALSGSGAPMVTYFDVDRGTLRFATKVNGTWQLSDIDVGTGHLDNAGDSLVGMYTSLTLRADNGRPGVAYLAHVHDAAGVHAEVRYAASQTTSPMGPGDWQTWVVDTGPVPVVDDDHPNFYPLPQSLGLFIDSARTPKDQAPVLAYYDRTMGELKLARFNATTSTFGKPTVIDGGNGSDAGWSPSVQVDENGTAHVAYVDTTTNDLKYVVEGSPPEIIDDGYRVDSTTVDGLPKPEFHFVGYDVNLIVLTNRDPVVVYQDATTEELLLARRSPTGWDRRSIAGGTDKGKWPGAYGFFVATAVSATFRLTNLIMSSWVIDQPTNENWVEVFTQDLDDLDSTLPFIAK